MGCYFLLQGISPNQELNLHLLHRQADLMPEPPGKAPAHDATESPHENLPSESRLPARVTLGLEGALPRLFLLGHSLGPGWASALTRPPGQVPCAARDLPKCAQWPWSRGWQAEVPDLCSQGPSLPPGAPRLRTSRQRRHAHPTPELETTALPRGVTGTRANLCTCLACALGDSPSAPQNQRKRYKTQV